MMAVARNIGDASASIKAGKWERSRLVGIEAKGKTLAIVGLGKGRFDLPLIIVQRLTKCSWPYGGPNSEWLWYASDCV